MNPSQESLDRFNAIVSELPASAPRDERSDEERLESATRAFLKGLDRQMAVDLDTCIHCGMCSEACHYFVATEDEKYTPAHRLDPLREFYRREVSPLRFAYRLFTRKPGLERLREWRELIYDSCTACGRCDMICPMGINLSKGINIMRQGLFAAGLAPAEMHAQKAEQETKGTLFGAGRSEFQAVVDELRESGVSVPLDQDKADVLVLTTAVDIRLFPSSVGAIARILNRAAADWTMSTSAFDAANAGLISGDDKTRAAALQKIVDHAKACGASAVVVPESGHAYQALRWHAANETGEALPFDVLSIAEYVARALKDGELELQPSNSMSTVTYHDPCRLGRHGGVFDEPREVLKAIGLEVRETESNRRENLCCGGGCGEYVITGNQALRQRAFELKRHEVDHTDAEAVVTGCNSCRLNFLSGAAKDGWDKPIVSFAETVAGQIAD